MPVSFLSQVQRDSFGRFTGNPSPEELGKYFYLSDDELKLISEKRGSYSRLGFAVQYTTVRFLGTFLDDPADVPPAVIQTLSQQLGIRNPECISRYKENRLHHAHANEIRIQSNYKDFTDPMVGIRLGRWLYTLCWTGTERPSVLFERGHDWMLTHKVLLPGITPLERFVARVKSRVEMRAYRLLGRGITSEQQKRLEDLLIVPEGQRASQLDQLRSGPCRISGPSLVKAIQRLNNVRELGITLPAVKQVPSSRLASLARYAGTAKAHAIARLPPERRLATLAAFVHSLEATANDDALELLEELLRDLFRTAEAEQRKARLRSIKDLDEASSTLADACLVFTDETIPDAEVRAKAFSLISKEELKKAVEQVKSLVQPSDDVYFEMLDTKYRSVRRYLPALLEHIRFEANPSGSKVVEALSWLKQVEEGGKPSAGAPPKEIISKPWKEHVAEDGGKINQHAYTFCTLDGLYKALRRRDIFANPSWRYADPRAGLLDGSEWEATRPVICRTLNLASDPNSVLDAMVKELDETYKDVAARLPNNSAVRFEMVDSKKELVLSPLDKLEEPASLLALQKEVASRLPRVDLPEILLEIAARTSFTDAFTHVSESTARASDLHISICASLLAGACNTGLTPLVRSEVPALRRGRIAWTNANYVRDETITAASSVLVSAQNQISLAHLWGGGEVASADGMRFVVPVRTIHAGPNPKYFGTGRGVTWYNMVSDQFTGLNAITVPGTLKDSLVLLAVVLDQQTELNPTRIMTDTGAYSDVIFGLFRLLGFRFSPRLADIGGTRFWKVDPSADYGELNCLARQRLNMELVYQNWDDILRLVASLKLGKVPAMGIMRTLQVGDKPTRLAQALAEFGRLEKTLHCLSYIDDEKLRRCILIQLNRGEARHSLARAVFHGKRGELRQKYREGQEEQLGALGLVVNVIVLWNTIYMDAILNQLRAEGYPVLDDDAARLSPLGYDHINLLGRYSFAVPDGVMRGELRPLRVSTEDELL